MVKKPNAIAMIIFNNPLYVVGACLSAWVHRQFISKLNLSIKLVVMINEPIHKYKLELEKYFDYVEQIELEQIKLNPQYNVIYKYSEWMEYSISKWVIFKFDKFNKILFVDTDILPSHDDFYDVFNYDTPAIMVRGVNSSSNGLATPELFFDNYQKDVEIDKSDYWNLSYRLKKSLDAGFVLISPNKKLYEEYFKFVKICEGSNGYISKHDSGVDETTLLFFLLFYKKIPTNLIPYNYAPTPWDKYPYDKNKIKGINFVSMVKPWVKLPMIQWADENIWHQIAKKSLSKHSIITKLYIKYMIDELYRFYKNWKKNIVKPNTPYNMECIKSNKLKSETFELFDYLKNHSKEDLTMDQMEYIITKSVQIHKHMNKKLYVPIDDLKNIVEKI